jgi:hypothetical protein
VLRYVGGDVGEGGYSEMENIFFVVVLCVTEEDEFSKY